MRRWRRKAAMVTLVGVLAGAGFAYLAANTVGPSSAGEGTGRVTVTTTPSGNWVTTTTSFQIPAP